MRRPSASHASALPHSRCRAQGHVPGRFACSSVVRALDGAEAALAQLLRAGQHVAGSSCCRLRDVWQERRDAALDLGMQLPASSHLQGYPASCWEAARLHRPCPGRTAGRGGDHTSGCGQEGPKRRHTEHGKDPRPHSRHLRSSMGRLPPHLALAPWLAGQPCAVQVVSLFSLQASSPERHCLWLGGMPAPPAATPW